jgi:hypothetical protein
LVYNFYSFACSLIFFTLLISYLIKNIIYTAFPNFQTYQTLALSYIQKKKKKDLSYNRRIFADGTLSFASLPGPVMTRHPVTYLSIWLDPCLAASLLRKKERFLLLPRIIVLGLSCLLCFYHYGYIAQGTLDNDILN